MILKKLVRSHLFICSQTYKFSSWNKQNHTHDGVSISDSYFISMQLITILFDYHISKHLKVCQKYSAKCCFSSVFSVFVFWVWYITCILPKYSSPLWVNHCTLDTCLFDLESSALTTDGFGWCVYIPAAPNWIIYLGQD